eukprot:TRINITY_DN917_c0_g1_i8.p1 TRINITY_DN917_c0_g1~~TRINITY_DN917_c0_g1_i8.p1  ORF type:complete len:230 (-),score=41.45 TRINITY_DN917_c0_g1_i8:168-857(-)
MGETVLISGATGAVGSIVGQIAKIKGCKVIGITGSDEKCRKLKEKFGFDAAINYTKQNLNSEIRKLCPNGVDIFFDNVGGEILDIALRRISNYARIVLCGATSQFGQFGNIRGPKNYMNLITRKASMTGYVVFDYVEKYNHAIHELTHWALEGRLVYEVQILNKELEEALRALSLLFNGKNQGKVIVQVSSPRATPNAETNAIYSESPRNVIHPQPQPKLVPPQISSKL